MCIFCQIASNSIPSRIILEDDDHIAFLTPFPNTDGFTVVATKVHYESYVFDLPEDIYTGLMHFSKKTASLLDERLGTVRTGLICEGMGINHVHTKLVPMHGLSNGSWTPVNSTKRDFYEVYQGYISSHDGPPQEESRLEWVYKRIIG